MNANTSHRMFSADALKKDRQTLPIAFENQEHVRVISNDGVSMVVKAGTIIGNLTLAMVVLDDGSVTEVTGLRFVFLDENQIGWAYSALLDADGLLPSDGTVVESSPRPQLSEYCYTMMACPRRDNQFELHLAEEPVIRCKWRNNSVAYRIAIEERHLRVHMQIGTNDPRAHQGILSVKYELGYPIVLWQRPMKLREKMAEIMGVPTISIERIKHSIPDMTLSTIRVEA